MDTDIPRLPSVKHGLRHSKDFLQVNGLGKEPIHAAFQGGLPNLVNGNTADRGQATARNAPYKGIKHHFILNDIYHIISITETQGIF